MGLVEHSQSELGLQPHSPHTKVQYPRASPGKTSPNALPNLEFGQLTLHKTPKTHSPNWSTRARWQTLPR
jgi:hypothetical protein